MALEIVTDTKDVLEVQEDLLVSLRSLGVFLLITNFFLFLSLWLFNITSTYVFAALLNLVVIIYCLFISRKITITLKKKEKTFLYEKKSLFGTKQIAGNIADIVHIFHKKRYNATPFRSNRHNTSFYHDGKSRLELLLENDTILVLNYKAFQQFDPWKTQFGKYEEEIGKHIAKFVKKPFINEYAYA